MKAQYSFLSKALGTNRVKEREPLSSHTYFKIGGPADLFFIAASSEDLVAAVRAALKYKIPYLILGGGSNVLIADGGFRGLVIKNRSGKINLKGFTGRAKQGKLNLKGVVIQADSGVPANRLIRYTLDEGLAGLEDFLGLPGTVGGAIFNNSHHLGRLIGNSISEVNALDRQGKLVTLGPSQLNFSYDSSIFQSSPYAILNASFQLLRGDKDKLWERANAVVRRRTDTQPLGSASSGCIFKNIAVSDAMRLGTPNRTCSAGYLIDQAGLKGVRIGGAVVSDVHANFIINDGGASAADVLKLIKRIQAIVLNRFSVKLIPEIFIIGETKNERG